MQDNHYVPRFIIDNFAHTDSGPGQIYVADIEKRKVGYRNEVKVFYYKGLYS